MASKEINKPLSTRKWTCPKFEYLWKIVKSLFLITIRISTQKNTVIIYLGLYFIFAMVNRKYKSETQAVWAASKQLANFLIGLCSRSRNRISRDWRLFNSLYYKLSLKIHFYSVFIRTIFKKVTDFPSTWNDHFSKNSDFCLNWKSDSIET